MTLAGGTQRGPKLWALAGALAASALVVLGTVWAYQRGSNDFSVFYEAWRLVLRGQGAAVYHATPDRFLYAPGFAWVFCFLGLLPRSVALLLWSLVKAGILAGTVRVFAEAALPASWSPRVRLGVGAWAVVLLARPVLIDIEYGQVNLMMLGASVLALSHRLKLGPAPRPPEPSAAEDAACWLLFGLAAGSKLFPLPLALIPFLWPGSRRAERLGVVAGILLALLAPVLTEGPGGAWSLLVQWKEALVSRGLPLESHDQSFTAAVYHYFSGLPTEIIAQHRKQLQLGWPLLSTSAIDVLSLTWLLAWSGAILWLLVDSRKLAERPGAAVPQSARAARAALLIGLLIVPSHLVWKPYFTMGLPAAALALGRYRTRWPWLLVLFVAINLTGFDVIGQDWAARVEASSVLLWAHLALLAVALYRLGSCAPPTQQSRS